MNKVRKLKKLAAAGALLALSAGQAMATPTTTDYDAIVAAVDWGDVITGIGAVGALIAAVLVVRRGTRMLLSMIGR